MLKTGAMNAALRTTLLALVQKDAETRARLEADGSLFDGYHPEMQAVHEANAATLADIIELHGWPGADLVGADGAEAAWLVAQHAIGLPSFQRNCLNALEQAAAANAVPAWQPAMLLDRTRIFEGLPQVYGTSFDWDEHGNLSPLPIEDPDGVDERRASVGLPPIEQDVLRHRRQAAGEPRPTDLAERQQRMDEWARTVGWRQ